LGCRFDKIINKEIPANIVYEDDKVMNNDAVVTSLMKGLYRCCDILFDSW